MIKAVCSGFQETFLTFVSPVLETERRFNSSSSSALAVIRVTKDSEKASWQDFHSQTMAGNQGQRKDVFRRSVPCTLNERTGYTPREGREKEAYFAILLVPAESLPAFNSSIPVCIASSICLVRAGNHRPGFTADVIQCFLN